MRSEPTDENMKVRINIKKLLGEKIRFIDLFAGIGGFHQAMHSVGARCVFASEWDSAAQKTYRANFHDSFPIAGDITKVAAEDIPKHDMIHM